MVSFFWREHKAKDKILATSCLYRQYAAHEQEPLLCCGISTSSKGTRPRIRRTASETSTPKDIRTSTLWNNLSNNLIPGTTHMCRVHAHQPLLDVYHIHVLDSICPAPTLFPPQSDIACRAVEISFAFSGLVEISTGTACTACSCTKRQSKPCITPSNPP